MDPEVWKTTVFDTIRRMASESYQRDAWFGKGVEVDSPDEMLNDIFDGDLFEEFLQSPDIRLSETQRSLGEELRQKLEKYADETDEFLDPFMVIDDPRWEDIRIAAKRFLEAEEP